MNNSTLQALDHSIQEYRAIQEKHITAFETELIPDLERQNFERAYAFAEMKNNLDKFSGNLLDDKADAGPDCVDAAALYITQIKKILASDAILKEKILIYQKELKQHLKNTGQVKTAFNGYAASSNQGKYIAMSLIS